MKKRSSNYRLLLLVLLLFAFRVLFGLSSEFWFDDELQIYLLGLKFYTTHLWPYYGPDVVYTNTQIPGALQSLLVGLPLFIAPIAESPVIFLNMLSALCLAFFAWYVSKRFNGLPGWIIWVWVFTGTWIMHYSTRVINPSYALTFSIVYFVFFFDLTVFKRERLFKSWVSWLTMGICTTLIMQLHLSYILLLGFTGYAAVINRKSGLVALLKSGFIFMLGALLGASTLIPTFFIHSSSPSVAFNVIFNRVNLGYILIVPAHFLAFASYEVPYVLGADTTERMAVLKDYPWMAPFAFFLWAYGFFTVIVYFVLLFFKTSIPGLKALKGIMAFSMAFVYLIFFISIANPSSHSFIILWPIPMLYSFYVFQWVKYKYANWYKLVPAGIISGLILHVGLGINSYRLHSLYRNRPLVQKSIEMKDYKILGKRRVDGKGYGY